MTTNQEADLVDGWSRDGSRIVFHQSRPGDATLANWSYWFMNSDGSNQIEIAGIEWLPSHDLTRRASSSFNQTITVVNLNGTGALELLPRGSAPDVLLAAWSPDDTRLVYSARVSGVRDLFVINADGSGGRNVTNSPAVNDAAAFWSPDGRRLVSHDLGSGSLYLVNTDGTGSSELVAGEVVGFPRFADLPSWSPDRQWIAFQFVALGSGVLIGNAIQLIRPDGTGRVQLTPPGLYLAQTLAPTQGVPGNLSRLVGGPEWSPDGKWIAFSARRSSALPPDQAASMFVVAVDGTRLIQLTASGVSVYRPRWKPQ